MPLKASVDHDDITWGELREFVRLGAHMPDDAPVAPALSTYNEEQIGFEVYFQTAREPRP